MGKPAAEPDPAAELARLRSMLPDHMGDGDRAQQANGWSAVWRALWDAGMCSWLDPEKPFGSGVERAVGFVRELGRRAAANPGPAAGDEGDPTCSG